MTTKIEVVPLAPPFIVEMPRDTKILTLMMKGDVPHLLVEIDPQGFPVKHTFSPVATGQEVPEHAESYVGTAYMEGGRFVVHFYKDKADAYVNH